jgi:hypothetical protein
MYCNFYLLGLLLGLASLAHGKKIEKPVELKLIVSHDKEPYI